MLSFIIDFLAIKNCTGIDNKMKEIRIMTTIGFSIDLSDQERYII